MMIVGTDIGGSVTKAILLDGGEVVSRTMSRTLEDPLTSLSGVLGKVISQASRELSDVECIAASGGKSRALPNHLFGIPIIKVDEMESIGIGGLRLSQKEEGLVASLGTGTAIVLAREGGRNIKHVGGTGVGGGTLMGLGQRLVGISDVRSLANLARSGSAKAVDLTVGDIVGGSVGILDPEMTASNFGRINESAKPEDLIAATFNMVSEVIGVTIYLASESVKEENIILVGTLSTLEEIASRVKRTLNHFGKDVIVPPFSEYSVAVGSAIEVKWERNRS